MKKQHFSFALCLSVASGVVLAPVIASVDPVATIVPPRTFTPQDLPGGGKRVYGCMTSEHFTCKSNCGVAGTIDGSGSTFTVPLPIGSVQITPPKGLKGTVAAGYTSLNNRMHQCQPGNVPAGYDISKLPGGGSCTMRSIHCANYSVVLGQCPSTTRGPMGLDLTGLLGGSQLKGYAYGCEQ